MSLDPGTKLRNRYHIEHLHKLGSHGAVYLAQDLASHISVAVKENLIAGPEHETQFQREAYFLAYLRHPSIPRATDYFMDDTGQFIVMDWLPGENLADWLRHDILAASALLPMLTGVCEALTYLHSLSPPIIHRDVEPSNLVLAPTGDVVLVDFGFAKVVDPAQPAPRTDARTDQYSFAATIYALLTGHIPIDALERATGRAAYVPATVYDPSIPPPVNEALAHAMAIAADDRYPDIATFWEALNRGS